MSDRALYLTKDEMGLYADGRAGALPSQRIAQYERNLHDLETRYAWRSSGEGARFTHQTNPYAGASQQTGVITAIAPLDGEMIYAVNYPELGGIYRKDYGAPAADEGFILGDMALRIHDLHARGHDIAAAVDDARGQRHIALLSSERAGLRLVTEGDTVDSGPFLAGDGWLYYASAGLARDEKGAMLAQGPAALLRMRPDTGALEVVAESPDFDYLRPKVAGDGALYCVRRPYRKGGAQARGGSLLDALLSPFRFVASIGKGLALLGRLLGGGPAPAEPATGGAKAKNRAKEKMTLNDLRVEINKSLRENEQRGDPHPGYAPGNWELVRVGADGDMARVRRGVIDYDPCTDGGFLVTNGRYLLKIGADGQETVLAKDKTMLRVLSV